MESLLTYPPLAARVDAALLRKGEMATMETRQALRLLLVEDCEDDALLLLRELSRQGFDVCALERVETADALRAALGRRGWDAVVSDFCLPTFSALEALAIVKGCDDGLPFILVSGTIGEETAVQLLKAGANDYVLKDGLARLGAALRRELHEVSTRREHRRLHEQLILSDRLASVGTLVTGVAHEINSPLAAVLANLEYMIVELGGACSFNSPEVRARVTGILSALRDSERAADRIREIVRDLRLLSRFDQDRQNAGRSATPPEPALASVFPFVP